MQIHDIIVNIAFLIVSTYLYRFNFAYFKENSIKQKIGTGILFGLISVLSMTFSFELSSGLIFDGRSIILGLSGLFGGIYASIISISIALVYRIILGGHGLLTGILVIIVTGLSGAFVHFYKRKYHINIKLYHTYIFGLFIHIITLSLFFTIPGKEAFQAIQNVWKAFIIAYPVVLVFIYYIFKDQEKRINEAHALQESEKTVRNSEIKFRAIFENSKDAIGVSKAGVHEFVNPAYIKLFGYTNHDEFNEKSILDLIVPDERIKILRYIKDRETGGINIDNYETKGLRKDGSEFDVEAHVSVYKLNNENYTLVILRDVTKRKLVEEAVLDNQKRYKKAQAMGHVGNWEYNLITSNFWGSDEAKRIYGFEMDSEHFTSERVEKCIIEREKVHQSLMDLIEHNKEYNIVYDIFTYDKGILKTIHSIAELEKDNQGNIKKITGVISDVTKRKQVEDELINAKEKAEDSERDNKEKANFIKRIIESSAISTWVSDENGTAIMTNPACLKFFGATKNEVLAKYNVFKDTIVEKHGFMPLIHNLFKKGVSVDFVLDYDFAKVNHVDVKDATHKTINTIATPIIGLNGQVSNVIFQSIDLTEIKKIERELIKAKEKAEESDRLKTAFLTNMSHEIRTPLNAVLGFSELLVRNNVGKKEKENFSDFIRLNGESLAKIIDDIIDISKLQSNQLTIKKFPFNLHILFNELHNYYSSLLVQKSKEPIKLVLELPEAVKNDFYIESDEQRLKQILNNLISNAIKYSEKGQITFGCKIEEKKLHFFVKDTGFGIAPENIGQIFDRFIQFSPQYVSKQDGTGLGLAICKNLVALLGGELKVESTVNKGSLFYFQIPLVRVEQSTSSDDDSIINLKKDLSKYKILIADDEDSNYVLTKRILKPSKVTVDWARNGRHAVDMVANNNYDLILMDIKMPEMDGVEATRLIKKQNKDIPIIIQTAFAMKEIKDEALEAGCDGFIVKPISLNKFLLLVGKYIKTK